MAVSQNDDQKSTSIVLAIERPGLTRACPPIVELVASASDLKHCHHYKFYELLDELAVNKEEQHEADSDASS